MIARDPKWKMNRDSGIPLNGREAFRKGYSSAALPWPKEAVECRFWLADWWRANAEAFKSHVEGG